MKYTSTRDASQFYTFKEALFSGYAPDGGLFVPARLPNLLEDPRVLQDIWPTLSYVELATEILHPFIGQEELPKDDLRSLLTKALEGFEVPDHDTNSNHHPVPVLPLVRKDGDPVDCYVAELFHGPTYCFKDLGMRATVFLLEYFASRNNNGPTQTQSHTKQTVVLTASTTGDTGPAAVRAVQDLDSPWLGIVVHYPQGQISDFQRQQMTTVHSPRVEIVAFEGGGDDMDAPIKSIMTKPTPSSGSGNNDDDENNKNAKTILVCGVNSYNIGRPLMQLVHFVWTYLRVVEHIQQETQQPIDPETFRLDVIIPTGAMGNIAGCYMAKQLGVPFGNLCAGVNANDFTHRAFSTGRIRKPKSDEPMKPSLSDAINIQLPYNLERLLFYLTHENHAQIKAWYDGLEGKSAATSDDHDHGNDKADSEPGTIDLTKDFAAGKEKGKDEEKEDSARSWLAQLQTEFRSARVTDDVLCETIRDVLTTYGYWIDPHTGVAFGAAQQLGYLQSSTSTSEDGSSRNGNPVAIMATASPCKFQAAMTQAVGPEKWKEYLLHHFPAMGKGLSEKKEKPPTLYMADPDKSLTENQNVWEAQTRALIAKLGS